MIPTLNPCRPPSPPFLPRAAGPLGTKEQLGYTVSATMVQQHPPGFNLSSYRVLVQSGDYGPEYLAHGRPFPCVRQVRWGMGGGVGRWPSVGAG